MLWANQGSLTSVLTTGFTSALFSSALVSSCLTLSPSPMPGKTMGTHCEMLSWAKSLWWSKILAGKLVSHFLQEGNRRYQISLFSPKPPWSINGTGGTLPALYAKCGVLNYPTQWLPVEPLLVGPTKSEEGHMVFLASPGLVPIAPNKQ